MKYLFVLLTYTLFTFTSFSQCPNRNIIDSNMNLKNPRSNLTVKRYHKSVLKTLKKNIDTIQASSKVIDFRKSLCGTYNNNIEQLKKNLEIHQHFKIPVFEFYAWLHDTTLDGNFAKENAFIKATDELTLRENIGAVKFSEIPEDDRFTAIDVSFQKSVSGLDNINNLKFRTNTEVEGDTKALNDYIARLELLRQILISNGQIDLNELNKLKQEINNIKQNYTKDGYKSYLWYASQAVLNPYFKYTIQTDNPKDAIIHEYLTRVINTPNDYANFSLEEYTKLAEKVMEMKGGKQYKVNTQIVDCLKELRSTGTKNRLILLKNHKNLLYWKKGDGPIGGLLGGQDLGFNTSESKWRWFMPNRADIIHLDWVESDEFSTPEEGRRLRIKRYNRAKFKRPIAEGASKYILVHNVPTEVKLKLESKDKKEAVISERVEKYFKEGFEDLQKAMALSESRETVSAHKSYNNPTMDASLIQSNITLTSSNSEETMHESNISAINPHASKDTIEKYLQMSILLKEYISTSKENIAELFKNESVEISKRSWLFKVEPENANDKISVAQEIKIEQVKPEETDNKKTKKDQEQTKKEDDTKKGEANDKEKQMSPLLLQKIYANRTHYVTFSFGMAYVLNNPADYKVPDSTQNNSIQIINNPYKGKFGMHLYPFKYIENHASVMGISSRKVHHHTSIYLGADLSKNPLSNLYVGMSVDVLLGVKVTAGCNFIQQSEYSVVNGKLERTFKGNYKQRGFIGVDVSATQFVKSLIGLFALTN